MTYIQGMAKTQNIDTEAVIARVLADPYTQEMNTDGGAAAADFIRAHPEAPAEHIPRENGALAALITELVMMAREQPASKESMELNFLLLDQRRLEEEIAAAGERGDYERRAQLSRERAALVERIAHAQRVAG